MPLDWFTKAGSSESVADLVRRGRFKKALKTLREEFDRGNRSVGLRLQFADILAKTGRTEQAIPILLGLASELHAAGEEDRAEEVLRQAEDLEPDRPEIVRKRKAFAVAAQRRVKEKQAAEPSEVFVFGEEAAAVAAWPTEPMVAVAESEPVAGIIVSDGEESAFSNVEDPSTLHREEPKRIRREMPTEAEVAAALAEAEATTASDDWVDVDGEAAPEVLFAQWSSEPSIADVAEMAVAQSVSVKQELVDCVRELAGRFPLPAAERPGPLHLAGALFEGLDEEQLCALVSGLRRQDFEAGTAMVSESEQGESIFILVRGRARVTVTAAHGRSFEVAELEEGSFFGEISVVGGRRTATVAAISPCETLEIASSTLESLSLCRPAAREIVEHTHLQRANSPEVEAVRAVPSMDEETPARALRVMDAHLGLKSWNPKMRLRFAEILAKMGSYADVVPVLVGLADEMQAGGQPARALAILHKIEVIERPADEEIQIAPLPHTPGPQRDKPGAPILTFLSAGKPAPGAKAIEHFRRFVQELMRDARGEAAPALFGVDAEELLGSLDFDRLAAKTPAKAKRTAAARSAPKSRLRRA